MAVSYSYKQDAYHVETLGEFIDNSYEAAFKKEKTDFYMIGIFETYEKANEYVETTRDLLSGKAVFELAAHTR